MRKLRIYFAHPFHGRERTEKFIKKLEEIGLEVVEPFSNHQSLTERWIKGERTPTLSLEIIKRDLEAIDSCDILLAYINTYKTIGTICEVFYNGYIRNKPTYVLSSLPLLEDHPWIYYAEHYTTQEDLLNVLTRVINGGEDKDPKALENVDKLSEELYTSDVDVCSKCLRWIDDKCTEITMDVYKVFPNCLLRKDE